MGLGTINEIKARRRALNLSERAFRVAQGLDKQTELEDWYHKEYDKDDHQQEDVRAHVRQRHSGQEDGAHAEHEGGAGDDMNAMRDFDGFGEHTDERR